MTHDTGKVFACKRCEAMGAVVLGTWARTVIEWREPCAPCFVAEYLATLPRLQRLDPSLACMCKVVGYAGAYPCCNPKRWGRPVCEACKPSLTSHKSGCAQCDPTKSRRKFDACECDRKRSTVIEYTSGNGSDFYCPACWSDWVLHPSSHEKRDALSRVTHENATAKPFRVLYQTRMSLDAAIAHASPLFKSSDRHWLTLALVSGEVVATVREREAP